MINQVPGLKQMISLDSRIKGAIVDVIKNKQYNAYLPPRPSNFVNREQELAKLLHFLHPDAAPMGIFIYGMGGVGKTALAIEAAYRVVEEYGYYDRLFFLTAKQYQWVVEDSDIEKIERRGRYRFSTLAGLINDLGSLLESSELRKRGKIEKKFEILQQVLEGKRILFIFDNLESLKKIENFKLFNQLINFHFPSGNKAIITSRVKHKDLSDGFVNIDLPGLTNESIFSLMKLYADKRQIDDVIPWYLMENAIGITLGIPLVLEQFFSFLNRRNSIHDIEILQREKLIPYLLESNVRTLEKEATKILKLIAKSPPLPSVDEIMQESDILTKQFQDIITTLVDLSLISIDGNTINMHELFQDYFINK